MLVKSENCVTSLNIVKHSLHVCLGGLQLAYFVLLLNGQLEGGCYLEHGAGLRRRVDVEDVQVDLLHGDVAAQLLQDAPLRNVADVDPVEVGVSVRDLHQPRVEASLLPGVGAGGRAGRGEGDELNLWVLRGAGALTRGFLLPAFVLPVSDFVCLHSDLKTLYNQLSLL